MSRITGIPFNEFSKKMQAEGQKILAKFETFLVNNLTKSHDRSRCEDEIITVAMWLSRAIKADQEIKDDMIANPLKYELLASKKKRAAEAAEKAIKKYEQRANHSEIEVKLRDGSKRCVIVERKKKSE